MTNPFLHISDLELSRCLAFAAEHPEIISRHHLLQKLTIFDFVAPLAAARRHDAILEIGCGQGIHSALLSTYGAVSATELAVPGSFVGADRDVNVARATVFQSLAERPVAFTYNDGRQMPYADESFDIVFHNSVIEHVPDISTFNREVRRVLRPGGICICITGTPALCRFRLLKDYLLKLPLRAAIAVVKEAPLLQEFVVGLLSVLGASDDTRLKIRERLQRVDDRLRALSGSTDPSGVSKPVRTAGLTKIYPRLYHYLYFPNYNRIVLDEIARDLGMTPTDLLSGLEAHFGSIGNRLRFALTPQTHGQHYRNVWDEMAEWRVERWQEQFTQTGFIIDDVRGYRYHHLLEFTPSSAWNASLYARAAKRIHAALDRCMFDPACASEIIIVAK